MVNREAKFIKKRGLFRTQIFLLKVYYANSANHIKTIENYVAMGLK
jgi:hypothetical protein